MSSPNYDIKRKRASSLRTQMFNKHLVDKFRGREDGFGQDLEMDSIQETSVGDMLGITDDIFDDDDDDQNENNDNNSNDNNMENNGSIPNIPNNNSNDKDYAYEYIDQNNDDGSNGNNNTNNNRKHPNKISRIFVTIFDSLLDRRRILHSKDGRHIPISLDHKSTEFESYMNAKYDTLIDERTDRPYCKNNITSSRYTIYSFLPKQLYAQFSKLANVYFFLIAILQMVPGWSTTGTYTTIIPLLAFMGISMAREAWDDFRRHRLDKEENMKMTKLLLKDPARNKSLWKDEDDNNSSNGNRPVTPTGIPRRSVSSSSINSNDIPDTHFTNFKLLANKHNVHLIDTEWKSLKVGDFVILKEDDWVPADILLLTSNGQNSDVYIETMALDGETNMKSRQPHPELNKLVCSASGLANINANVTVEDPNNDLYNFEGNLELHDINHNAVKKYPIGPDNVIYRGSIIRNTPYLVGMVIFTGEETKIRMNAIRNPRTKAPKLQRQINLIIVFMVFVVACVSFFSYLGHVLAKRHSTDHNEAWYLFQQDAGVAPTIMSFIIMYNTMIPLSLYVTMEIIKVAQSKLMEWDIDMYYKDTDTPCESRTATILEELGQVSYIFSDKTGTLTDNKMIFRKYSILGSSWLHYSSAEEPEKIESGSSRDTDIDVISMNNLSIMNNFGVDTPKSSSLDVPRTVNPRASIEYKGNSSATYVGRPSINSLYMRKGQQDHDDDDIQSKQDHDIPDGIKTSYDMIKYIQEKPNTLFSKKAKFFILAMALCHTCLPKREDDSDSREDAIEYQSSSPDELALITAARDMGFVLINKNAQILTIKTYPNGFDEVPVLENYDMLDYIEFNSKRKRMSVIVKIPNENNQVLLICKGADNMILERLRDNDIAMQKLNDMNSTVAERKGEEAELVIQQRKSLERLAYDEEIGHNALRPSDSNNARASLSLQAIRKSISQRNKNRDPEGQIDSIDDILSDVERNGKEIDDVINRSRKSLHKQQLQKYGPRVSMDVRIQNNSSDKNSSTTRNLLTSETQSIEKYIGQDDLLLNDEYVIEKTIQAIDDFSTEGLRTLLYAYRWIDNKEYQQWSQKYNKAKTALVDRKEKIDEIGEQIEYDLSILGVTAIEDKLQDGVTEAIEKIKRAGIKMWMLTGDKRETAINIGYSCKLIYDYSTVVILATTDENIISKINAISQEIDSGNMAHCVIVIDGATLATFESNPTLMSVFVELCTKTDSVICCRASPSQKALMVSNIRNTNKGKVTLAIGDGANDIAMIQAADLGVGIAGKEGLQASRSSDYSIAQFRFLLKLLFVHGRYNYIRTAKFVLCTFYKELTFYLTQVIFQRYTLFSGSSLYEPWSLSMFNTLFTSLPVLCIGIFEKDLKPSTLLTIPELYSYGRLGEGFGITIFLEWMIEGACNSVIITFLNVIIWGETALSDSTMYPLGLVNFTAIVALINVKAQFLEMHNKNWLAFASVILSAGGWLVWCCALPILNRTDKIYDVPYGFYYHFGNDITFWCTCLVLTALPIIIDIVYQTFKTMLFPTDSDIFAELEKNSNVRKKLELGAYNEMKQGWTWHHDDNAFKRYKAKIFNSSNENGDITNMNEHSLDRDISLEVLTSSNSVKSISQLPNLSIHKNSDRNSDRYEILPSGKMIKKENSAQDKYTGGNAAIADEHVNKSKEAKPNLTGMISKKLRFTSSSESEEDIADIIRERMKDLE